MNAPLTEKAPERALSIKRIVVAVALSPHSEATARYAVEIAKAFGASIVLVHVQAPPEVNENITQAGYQEVAWQQQGAQEALANLTKTLQGDYPACEECFLTGKPAEQVAGLARELNADLIITASQHPGFLGRLFHLDRAPQIVYRAPCPVLVYHEKGRG
jgi:nucleotide-binding universal stress UspA family protein